MVEHSVDFLFLIENRFYICWGWCARKKWFSIFKTNLRRFEHKCYNAKHTFSKQDCSKKDMFRPWQTKIMQALRTGNVLSLDWLIAYSRFFYYIKSYSRVPIDCQHSALVPRCHAYQRVVSPPLSKSRNMLHMATSLLLVCGILKVLCFIIFWSRWS